MSVGEGQRSELDPADPLTHSELRAHLSVHDSKRLELYSRNMADHHLITDLLPQCE